MHMDGASHVVLAWPSSIYLRPHSSRAPSGQALLNGARAFRDAATGPHGLPRTETHRPSCRGASAHTLEHEVGCCNAGVAGGPLVDRLCGSRGGRLRRHCPTKHSQAEAHDGPRSLPDLATHAVAQPRVAQCFAAPVQKPLAFTSVSTSRAHGVVVSHPLRMRKALGSNPSVSILFWNAPGEAGPPGPRTEIVKRSQGPLAD